MATIVYLDAEDEITSAASRIRGAGETRVGLVLPFGSRVATSRINFRLLAREAMDNGRRLDIIASDASARALAASAGLPVFGSVGEYEDALAQGGAALEATRTTAVAAAAGAAAGAAVAGQARPAGGAPKGMTAVGGRPAPEPAEDAETAAGSHEPPVVRPRRRIPVRALVAALVLVLLVGGGAAVAGYLLLPAATITITPHIEAVGPISFNVRADPDVTEVNPTEGVVPAQTLSVPVESQGEFPATGKRVATTPAQGGVRWTNCDPTRAYTISAGTVVKTGDGTAFSIDEQVFLPVAPVSGTPPNLKVKCQTSEVSVTAVKAGPGGNVDADTITVVPAAYNRSLVSVTNPLPTTGGSRQEFPRVTQKDVDAAVEQLDKDIQAQFAAEVENPSRVPPGMTVFPGTAVLGDPVPAVDPATLVGQEVDSFTLRMTADGTVLAVDPAPVTTIARDRLTEQVTPGYELVEGSTSIEVGDGVVVAGVVTFPVTGSAKQRQPIDAASLESQVLGLDEADAQALLAPYGDVTIVLWPGWVHAVPTLQQRVSLTVNEPVDTSGMPAPASPSAPAGPGATPGSSGATPGGSEGAVGSEPVPSGG
jgi:hypothetical protein